MINVEGVVMSIDHNYVIEKMENGWIDFVWTMFCLMYKVFGNLVKLGLILCH